MFPAKKFVGILLIGLLFTSVAWGETFEDFGGDYERYNTQSEEELDAKAPFAPPPFILDFATGPFPITRSHMTGYLNTADGHTLPQGKWRAGISNVASFWSYQVFGTQIDNNFLDSIFGWGVGLYDGVEFNVHIPIRFYYNAEIDGQGVDFEDEFGIYDSTMSLKAVYGGEIATVGLGVTQTFPIGNEDKGFGGDEWITKVMGIFSLYPGEMVSLDMNLSYYFGGSTQNGTFVFEGFVFNLGFSWELQQGFALYGQLEYWNPFVPSGDDNDRMHSALGVKVQTTDTGAVFFGLGFNLKSPELSSQFAAANFDEDYYIYLSVNFMEHW